MAQPEGDSFNDDGTVHRSRSFTKDSDAAFHATPVAAQFASKPEESALKSDPTFIQNQISIQRSSSMAKEHASNLSRKLSTKASGNIGPNLGNITPSRNTNFDEDRARGRERGGSDSSVVEGFNDCTLSKTGSERSGKSVRSLHALGSYPLGTLRVHSPSPSRGPRVDSHECLKSGDVVIIRDVPAGSLIGYDTRAFVIKKEEHFEGIKEFSTGAHFIWGGSSSASLRTGFWIMSARRASDEYGEIHVRRWDSYSEVIDVEVSAAELRIQKDGLPEIFDKLHTYDGSSSKTVVQAATSPTTSSFLVRDPNIWHNLTSSMKGALLTKITGYKWNQWQVSSNHDYQSAAEVGTSVPDDKLDFGKDEVLNFTFPKDLRTFSSTSFGRERTEQAMDTSSHVMAIITGSCTYEDSDEIIGELQFCYITGMLLGNITCMEHWAHVVKVLFKAFRLALDYPQFFRKVIEAVHTQFIYDEEGLEGSILDHDPSLSDDLRIILTTFKSRLNEQLLAQRGDLTPEQSAVGKAFEELESWLWKWGWDLRGNYVRSGKIQLEDGEMVDAELKDFEAEDERGEFAPQIVELDDNGREKGLFSL